MSWEAHLEDDKSARELDVDRDSRAPVIGLCGRIVAAGALTAARWLWRRS